MNMSWQGFSTAMPKTPLLPSVTLLALLLLSGCNDILIREAVIEMKVPASPGNKGMSFPDHARDAI